MRSVDIFSRRIRGYPFAYPGNPNVPPYYAKGSYIQFAVAAMALVNSGYIGLGLFNLVPWPSRFAFRVCVSVTLSVAFWLVHITYYSRQAHKRESHSKGTNELRWKT